MSFWVSNKWENRRFILLRIWSVSNFRRHSFFFVCVHQINSVSMQKSPITHWRKTMGRKGQAVNNQFTKYYKLNLIEFSTIVVKSSQIQLWVICVFYEIMFSRSCLSCVTSWIFDWPSSLLSGERDSETKNQNFTYCMSNLVK